MKTIVSVFLYVIICSIQIYAVSAEEINLNAKAAVIMDAESGKPSMRNPRSKNAECQYNKDFNMFIYFKAL